MTDRPGPMYRAVCAAIREAKADKLDAGTVALAKHYATLIDNAAPAAKYHKALRVLQYLASDDEIGAEAFDTVRVALAQHTVASDLGPKLLAALTALGLTPAARKAAMKGSTNDGRGAAPDPLGQLRDEVAEQRGKRERGAG